jgi:hypothetical protein
MGLLNGMALLKNFYFFPRFNTLKVHALPSKFSLGTANKKFCQRGFSTALAHRFVTAAPVMDDPNNREKELLEDEDELGWRAHRRRVHLL